MEIRIRAAVFAIRNSSSEMGVVNVRIRDFLDLSCTMVIEARRKEINISTIEMIPGIRKSRLDLFLNTESRSSLIGAAIKLGDLAIISVSTFLVLSISYAV